MTFVSFFHALISALELALHSETVFFVVVWALALFIVFRVIIPLFVVFVRNKYMLGGGRRRG